MSALSGRRDGAAAVGRALISVSDKSGLVPLAQALVRHGIEILSTGGTASTLAAAGLSVVEVSTYTGFPELMEGRLKTLHPRVHGGLLARTDHPADVQAMQQHGIQAIDLLIVNLYPFESTIARAGVTRGEAIEQIDIGGPAMLRAAAKNQARVAAVVDPADYAAVLLELDESGGVLSDALRARLAAKVFRRLAAYDSAIADYLEGPAVGGDLPGVLDLRFEQRQRLRYGENPHQRGALYVPSGPIQGLAAAERVQGKELSFNNLLDADAAWTCVQAFSEPTCVIVKHGNPCGVAQAADLTAAYDRAHATDPTSAFGGVIAINRPLDAEWATLVLGRQFVEVLLAPAVEDGALAVLRTKPNIRVLIPGPKAPPGLDLRRINGGLLVQDPDLDDLPAWQVVSDRAPTGPEMADLVFGWRVAKFVKSNAIVYAKDQRTLGVGAGQMSRVDSARIAIQKAADASLDLTGTALASDAFFPFRDSVDHAAAAGVAAVIEPGGSMRDDEVIRAANEHGMALVFTGMRHFRH